MMFQLVRSNFLIKEYSYKERNIQKPCKLFVGLNGSDRLIYFGLRVLEIMPSYSLFLKSRTIPQEELIFNLMLKI